jgi:hypothetical protein
VLTVAVKEWSWLHENPMRNVRMPRMPSGYLIVDDPVVAKSSARLCGEAAWVWSSKDSKRIRDSGWYCVWQRKKNRRFEGRPLSRYLQQP